MLGCRKPYPITSDRRPSEEMRNTLPLCLPSVVSCCPPLGDDELTSRGESKGCGKFTHIRGLRERIREQFVLVGFAVPVGVQQPSDPIFVEDE